MSPRALSPILLAGLIAASCDGQSRPDGGSAGAGDSGPGEAGRGETRPAGKSTVGGACSQDQDCAEPPSGKCYTTIGGGLAPLITFPGGYCSAPCSDDGGPGCGDSGGCSSLSSSAGGGSVSLSLCTRPCTRSEECRLAEGYTCRIIFLGFGYCAPP